jgi:hypothetical protein
MKAKRKVSRKLINTGTVGKYLRATTGDGNWQNWDADVLDDAVTTLEQHGVKAETADAFNEFLLGLEDTDKAQSLVNAISEINEIVS